MSMGNIKCVKTGCTVRADHLIIRSDLYVSTTNNLLTFIAKGNIQHGVEHPIDIESDSTEEIHSDNSGYIIVQFSYESATLTDELKDYISDDIEKWEGI